MAKAPGRPRPGTAPGGSGSRGVVARLGYFKGVWEELKKVVWPTRDELWRMTGVVVATVVLFGLLVGATDFGLSVVAKPLYPANTGTTSTTATPGATVTTPATAAASATPTAAPTATPST